MSGRNYGRAVLAAVIALAACDDSTTSKQPKQDAACEGFGGCGETGDTGVTGGTGGAGGETPPGKECLDDSGCDASEFCAKTDGELKGACTEGCRADGCGEGQICTPDHVCGCTGDTGCAADQFCDTADSSCKPGCRPGDASSCPEGQSCNENHECEAPPAQAVCCGGAEGTTCSLTTVDTCDGTFLSQVSSCDPDPCGPTCADDTACAADRYCSDQGICIPGCREAPNDNCPDGTYCDPAKNTCEPDAEVPCQTSDECADGQFCEVETGLCLPGCDPGVAGECPPGEVCGVDNTCVPGCNQDVDCNPGQYCDPEVGCQDFCVDNDACQEDQFCDLGAEGGGRCVAGCRDDANDLFPGSNNDRDTATPIQLVDNHGEVQGQLVCPNNPDVYAIELFQQARVQIILTAADPNAGDVKIRLWGPDANADPLLENLQPGSPKRLRYPEEAGMGVPAAATYYIEVYSEDPASQAYDLSITLIDALGGGDNACFPEDGEFDNGGRGHNVAADAVDLMWNGNRDETYTFSGSVCGSDEDWFTFASPSQDAGASIELVVDGLVGEAVVELYNSLTVRNLGNPNYTTGAGVGGAGGTVTYRLDIPRDQAQLSEDTWYVRLRGRDAATVLDDYGLNINLLAPGGSCGDASEPNDAPNESTNLDVLAGISDRGRVQRDADLEIPLELSLCARDEDWFAFTANDGDQVRAWATSPNLAGSAEITIATPDGNALGTAGSVTQAGQNTDPASLNGTNPGVYYVRVRSLAAGTADPYTLFIHINPTAMCGADVAEVGPGGIRNDSSATATLMSSVDLESLRYEYAAGLVCNVVATPDQDWYRVNVAEDETRVCIASEFQDLAGGDLSLEVFDCENDPAEDVPCNVDGNCSDDQVRASRYCIRADSVCGCRTDADCDVDNDGLDANDGRCVESRCKQPIARSTTDGAPELVDLARGIVGAGDLCILVSGADRTNENAYELDVTLNVAGQLPCVPDWRERNQPNDDQASAVYLGNRQAGVCDAWLCNNERGTGDWYSIDVPAGESRTVLVTYSENSDGRAVFLMQAKDVGNPDLDVFYERPLEVPPDSREECVNITSGADGSPVLIGVQGDREQVADADEQIDYTLRVLPYDPATHPDGRCAEFVGNPQSVWSFDIP